MRELANRRCMPCEGGVPALAGDAIAELLRELDNWEVINEHHLRKTFAFPNFLTALAFVNQVGGIAEQEGHHPDITFTWGQVEIRIHTHKIDGLTESDFILAAKVDQLSTD